YCLELVRWKLGRRVSIISGLCLLSVTMGQIVSWPSNKPPSRCSPLTYFFHLAIRSIFQIFDNLVPIRRSLAPSGNFHIYQTELWLSSDACPNVSRSCWWWAHRSSSASSAV